MIMSLQSHLVRQYDQDINELKHLLFSMGDLVLQQIADASQSVRNGDIDLAQTVCDRDAAINALEVSTDRCATLLIAKHQPAASRPSKIMIIFLPFALTQLCIFSNSTCNRYSSFL